MIGAYARGLKTFILSRAGHFFFVFGYLWLLLSVSALHNSIVLEDWRLLGHLGPAMLKALVFTKFLLIGEHLGLAGGFEDKPLIWPILIKAALFSALLIGFDIVEVITVNAIWPHAAAKSSDGVDPSDLRTALSFSFMAFVALIPFFGIREFSKVIGEDRVHDLLFHRHAKVPQA
jgi:hypothetical protein